MSTKVPFCQILLESMQTGDVVTWPISKRVHPRTLLVTGFELYAELLVSPISPWFWYKFWNYTILWYKINTHLLTNFTSISRKSSQTQTFSSVFVTDLVRSLIIEAIASCGKLRTKGYNQGYNILCNLKNYKKSTWYKVSHSKVGKF